MGYQCDGDAGKCSWDLHQNENENENETENETETQLAK